MRIDTALLAVLATCPVMELRDVESQMSIARRFESVDSTGSFHRYTAIGLYGAGKFEQALEQIDEATRIMNGGDAIDRFVKSIILTKLNETDSAAREYSAAVSAMELGEPVLFDDLGACIVNVIRSRAAEQLAYSRANGISHDRPLVDSIAD